MGIHLVSAILISIGSLVILISAAKTNKLLKVIRSSQYRSAWVILFSLMVSFALGYMLVLYWGAKYDPAILSILTGLIFFFGSLFVFLTVSVGSRTIIELLQTTVSRSYLDNIIKSMADSLVVIDLDKQSTIKTVNNATVNLLGYTEEELIGASVSKILTDKDIELLNKTNGVSDLIDIEMNYRTKEGTQIPVSFSASILKDHFGQYVGMVYVAQDISERKNAEQKIKEYIQKITESELKLKELNASKDKFFSIIAHDLRNPFGAVLGFAEIIFRDALEMPREELVEFSTYIYKQTRTIYELLENLLAWSRIQTGRIEYHPDFHSIVQCIQSCIIVNHSIALKKQIELSYNPEGDDFFYADKDMIQTVLRNLLSNAMKFTAAGGRVTIACKRLERMLEISVEDTGAGMSETDMQKLFRIDVHHSTQGTDEEKGTGLGLLLCKEFTEKNNGSIKVESELGQGSKFTFTVPVKPSEN